MMAVSRECQLVQFTHLLLKGFWVDGREQVNNFVSLGGPHAGTASVPLCSVRAFQASTCHSLAFLSVISVNTL